MSDWIIIPKQHLKKIDRMLPKPTGILQKLEPRYDPYPENKKLVLILPSQFHENMELCFLKNSLDWNLGILLQEHIEKLWPRMPQADQVRLKEALYGELNLHMSIIMRANVRRVVERESKRGKPSVFNRLSREESEMFMSLFGDATRKAVDMGLNVFQVFLEGKLDCLMLDDPRLDDYNRLSDDKKKQLRRNFIETNGWEAFYSADAG